MDSVRAAADHVMARAKVTSFVGNAGLQVTSGARRSADGHEVTFAVNVLANHLLLRLLGDQLRRVVITASDTHFGDLRHNLGLVPAPRWRPPTELARPDRPDTAVAGRTAYSTSKLAVIYLVHEWARRLADAEVFAWNPGFVPGTGPAVAPSGSYVNLGRAERSSAESDDPQRERDLFAAAESLTAM